ncbi:MAG: aminoacetone oxidase family FAD-binding enzyme [Lachnospiraceae bacterium]|nr:aminoacetone oxidase family FAD-binding enzyme [Lachnospiraceae bacterium]
MKIAVIGGGAAGLCAAVAAARKNAYVTVFEKNDKVGKKILMTGNGKCNLTNTNLSSDYYYSEDRSFISDVFDRFGLDDTIRFFGGLGLLLTEKRGGVYPNSEQASAVLDALRFETEALNVSLKCGCNVKDIVKCKDGFNIIFGDADNAKNNEFFDRVIITTGGKAAPKTGSDGSGYVFASKFKDEVSKLYPALGGVKCEGNFWKSVSGVRCGASVQILDDTTGEGYSIGEIQLTDYGISGIVVFQISRIVASMLDNGKVKISIDLLPDLDEDTLSNEFFARALVLNGRTYEQILNGFINKKLSACILKRLNINPNDVAKFDEKTVNKLINEIKHFKVVATGVNPFDQAQTTAGGIKLKCISKNFESIHQPGIFYAGEILDVDGICGGYNLQWAWSSGFIAGEAAAKC